MYGQHDHASLSNTFAAGSCSIVNSIMHTYWTIAKKEPADGCACHVGMELTAKIGVRQETVTTNGL